MKVELLQLLEGASKAKGLTVVIDVFRAFSVEAYLLSQNAKYIIPVKTVEEAFALKKLHPDYLLVGERKGKKIDGFDYGNSPSEISGKDFSDRIIIHTTSAGVQGLKTCENASIKITGALVNAKAIATFILQNAPEYVSLVCMGLEGKEETDEDTLCAKYIHSLLRNKPIDIDSGIESLKYTSGAKFFDKNNPIFPETDFYLSTKVNCFNFVIVEKDGKMYKMNVCQNK